MSGLSWRLVCPKCGSDEFRQYGSVGATWGGEAWEVETKNPDGSVGKERVWRDDGLGADMAWDAYTIEEYYCQACQFVTKDLADLSDEEVGATVQVVHRAGGVQWTTESPLWEPGDTEVEDD